MIGDNLRKFDLHFPGNWIEGADRDWAFQSMLLLRLIEDLFVESVATFSLFRPMTKDNYQEFLDKEYSPYERCLKAYTRKDLFLL